MQRGDNVTQDIGFDGEDMTPEEELAMWREQEKSLAEELEGVCDAIRRIEERMKVEIVVS